MTVSATLQADLATIPGVANVTARTAVGIPPSDVDSDWRKMRVAISGWVILRDYDPGTAIVTGAPLMFLTEGGDDLLTEAGDALTTETA